MYVIVTSRIALHFQAWGMAAIDDRSEVTGDFEQKKVLSLYEAFAPSPDLALPPSHLPGPDSLSLTE
jgi:hypothetical protein